VHLNYYVNICALHRWATSTPRSSPSLWPGECSVTTLFPGRSAIPTLPWLLYDPKVMFPSLHDQTMISPHALRHTSRMSHLLSKRTYRALVVSSCPIIRLNIFIIKYHLKFINQVLKVDVRGDGWVHDGSGSSRGAHG